MHGRGLVALVASLTLVSGCASADGGVGVRSPGSANRALKLWNDFPAGSSPRPVVLTGPTVSDPSTGFRTVDAKLAYLSGRFTVATRLPTKSSTWRRQPLITAAQALADLRGNEHGGPASAPLVITKIRLGRATFSTDRGKRGLPAWRFTLADVRHPASVLAVAPANRWPKADPVPAYTDFVAKITPGGETVTIGFTGAPAGTGPCEAQYKADIAQSGSAVAISIEQSAGSDSGSACTAVGYQRTVTVALNPALGGRVLIDSHGVPIPAG